MASKNLSVDDIIDEIKMNNSRSENPPTVDMQHVDLIIKDILTKRQDEQIKRENRSISLKEKKNIEDEIEVQTQNLTHEFKKLSKTLDGVVYSQPTSEPKLGHTEEIKLSAIRKQQQVKFRDTTEVEIPKELRDKKEQKYQELKKVANTQQISQDMLDISRHFGNLKTEDEQAKPKDKKPDMPKEVYQELKVNRNKKIGEFVLEHKEDELVPPVRNQPQNIGEAIDKEYTPQSAFKNSNLKDIEQEEENTEYEYRSRSQNGEVRKNLVATSNSVKTSLIMITILSIISIALFLTKVNQESILLVGQFPIKPSIYAIINMALILVAMVTSLSIFSNALVSLSEQKADKDILYSLTIIVCFLANVAVCLKPEKLLISGITLYTPILLIMLLINFLSKSLSIKKIIKNFDFISTDGGKYALTNVEERKTAVDMTKGVVEGEPLLAKNVKVSFFDNFLSNSFKPDLSDKAASKIAIFSIPVAIVIGLITFGLTKEIYLTITIVTATMLMLTSFIGAMIVAFPLYDTADIVSHFSGMMPEYSAIDTYKQTDAILINTNELFPEDSIVLHGIKTFKGKRIDDAIVNAASVVCSAESILKGVFLSIINNKTELLRHVDTLAYEDLMGMSAWVDEKRVLIGNRELMINHSVAVPKAEYEDKYRQEGYEVVFLASGGELCAAFIIEFTQTKQANEVINLLYKNDIVAVIKTVDACVTGEMLERVFNVDAGLFKIIPSRLHKSFDRELEPKDRIDSLLGNNGSVFGSIVSIVACKKLASCTKLGMVMYILSAVCGVAMLAVMVVLKNLAIIGNLQLLIFMASFAVVYWIYEKNMKL